MTEQVQSVDRVQESEAAHPFKNGLRTGENLLITFCLAAMVLIPLAEMALRSTKIVIRGSSAIQSHLTLFVCMIGGAIAAGKEGCCLCRRSRHF